MRTTITWLHLSDLHACPTKTGWDASHVTKSLCDDLKELQHDHKLRPDFIFFTGDAMFGQLGDKPGLSVQDQYKAAQKFLDEVRCSFRPELAPRDIYLVPGNHDINTDDTDNTQAAWLRDPKRSLEEIVLMMQEDKAQWRRFMERLQDYKAFLKSNGYDHLLTDDKNRLIYADAREVAGLRIGIAGLNSAWSCFGEKGEKAHLWCGGKYQVEELRPLLSKVDFSIALIHHPGNWFVEKEDPNVQRLLEATFQFVLHGHEHQEWVKTDAKTGHTTIWAGACYDRSDHKNGFNVVQLDRKTGKGRVWLREYKETGQGWVACNIRKFAPHGIWTLDRLEWFQTLKPALATVRRGTRARSKTEAKPTNLPKDSPTTTGRARANAKTADYERRLCEAMVRKYDYLELFGADIPRESQRHALSVAYVSLNLSDEDEDAGESTEEISPATTVSEIPEQREKPEPFVGARPVDEVFDRLNPATGRLLIRGVAGGGKSTLLRWASIQAAKFNLENHDTRGDTAITTRDVATCEVASMGDIQKVGISATAPEVDNTLRSRPVAVDEILNPRRHNWRTKIPFLIRLRDCPEGALPRPKDLPALIAKELPDPPPEWIDQILKSGRALLLFDGVDEIPSDKRELLAREIENLINEYPDNYCIVSTRPGAVDRGWLSKLNFFEARIEPMSTDDQDEFIDKWYSAVSAELRASGRRAENLDKLSTSLKQELRDTPGIAKLAIYPLLCAMICALYRERNQKLPETQAALCEDLCKMLLHRRERETPDMKLIHLPPDYRKLDYEHKKYIVAELAKIMVEKGVSSLDETEADNLLKLALQHFPDHANSSPQQMRRALVERSGLLRPSGANRIDFLHNTLKEYLAAGRFVMDDAYKLLANHAEDDTWQPVILFAAALPTPGFASKLMRELLKPVQRGNFLAEQQETVAPNDTATAPPKRNQEFFVVRCRNAAFRLDPDLVTKVNRLASGLFPPNTIADAEALASLGEAIIPHLDPKQRLGTRQKVACIRALRLVGGPKAKTLFRRFPPGKAKSVLLELLGASADLGTAIKLTNDSLDLSSTSIRNLSPLKGQAVLRFLELADTRVSDLTPIASLTKLHHLNIARTPVNDLAPLSTLTSLQSLDLTGTRVLDFTPLAKLSELQVLHMGRSRPSPYMPYDYRMHPYMASDYVAYLNKLTEDDILERAADYNVRFYHGRIRSIRGFAESIRSREEQLERLFEDSPTHSGKQFATLVRLLSRANLPMEHGLYSLAPALIQLMANYPHIPERLLSEMQDRIGYHLVDSENFERWLQKELEHLTVRGTKAIRSMLAPLSGLQKLRVLSLDGLPVYDLSALSTLKRLRFLGLSSTCAADLSPLTRLRELRWLDLSGCPTSDISALHGHVDLRVLNLSVTEISDLSPLIGSMTLRVLNLVGSKVSDFSPLFRLPSLRTLIVARHSAGDRKSRANQSRQLAELKRACPELEIHRLV